MGSVRERIERELREAPEKIVPTGDRRTALSVPGVMSTRQQAQFAEDQANPEVIPVRQTTSSASVGMEQGSFSRVRDRQVVTQAMKPEPPRPKTQAEIDADASVAMHKRREAEAKASERPTVNAYDRQIAEAKAKVAAEVARQKKAQHDFLEAAVMRECEDLTDDEKTIFWTRLVAMDACLDAGRAAIVAEDIRLSRRNDE